MFFMKVSSMLSHPLENSELLRHAEVMLKTSWESKGALENIWGKAQGKILVFLCC